MPLKAMQVFKDRATALGFAEGLAYIAQSNLRVIEIREYDDGFGVIYEDSDRECETNYVYKTEPRGFRIVLKRGENHPEDLFE